MNRETRRAPARAILTATLAFACFGPPVSRPASGQALPVASPTREEATIQASAAVLQEALHAPGNRIPQAMLRGADGVAIIPNVVKGSFVVGVRHGRGVLLVKDAAGTWHAPVFITLTGGNIGWQAGINASDIVLVFKTQRSIQGLLSGKLTLGADAAAAAGPVGRQTAIATDGSLQAEIYSYSRSRGLFAGVALDGSVVRVDPTATANYYPASAPGQPPAVPPAALQLTQTIAGYADGVPAADPNAGASSTAPPGARQPFRVASSPAARLSPPPGPASELIRGGASPEADVLRGQLAQLAPELYERLDARWREFLSLPAALSPDSPHPQPEQLRAIIERYDQVAADVRYRELASRPEFQSVRGLLKHYAQTLGDDSGTIELPPPPTSP